MVLWSLLSVLWYFCSLSFGKVGLPVYSGLGFRFVLLLVIALLNWMEERMHPFNQVNAQILEILLSSRKLDGLPRGIIQARSDLELRPLWLTSSKLTVDYSNRNLLAIAAGIKQKHSVDDIVQKFLPENFTIILFHYDGNVKGWWDLEWSNQAIHIVAHNQTKWWFAKRFPHPDVVSIYDYIFLWDEDLGVEDFNPQQGTLKL
ncbi:uncharacterized protein LOC112194366 [Rosa chinensis]|uniref:uncharacterized protein LOC112194366 n=1 Tax=Rosa chinensis TaxID=74649 RepID=UPI001AD906DD|nr:uncharacterized protein LOC112194366 [Rosa chinensis]